MTELIHTRLIARKTCDPPDPRPIRAKGKNDPLKSEEIGSFWLWAWPDLLGWPFQLTWLFSPVTGKSKWPGDLWGLDDRGNLLIVETKVARNDRGPQDPFRDFIGFEESPNAKVRRESVFEVPALRYKWLRLLKQERDFIEQNNSFLSIGKLRLVKHPGVVPYSYKRSQTWTWPQLYLHRIAPMILGKRSEKKTELSFLERARKGNSRPHYFALFTVYGEGTPSLSGKGLDNYKSLRESAGKGHVHLVAVTARPVRRRSLEVISWRLALKGYHSLCEA